MPLAFGSATQVTDPPPVPVVAPEKAIQAAPLTALQAQAPVVVTDTVPLPPLDGAAIDVGDAVYWHDVPSCVTTCTAPCDAERSPCVRSPRRWPTRCRRARPGRCRWRRRSASASRLTPTPSTDSSPPC